MMRVHFRVAAVASSAAEVVVGPRASLIARVEREREQAA